MDANKARDCQIIIFVFLFKDGITKQWLISELHRRIRGISILPRFPLRASRCSHKHCSWYVDDCKTAYIRLDSPMLGTLRWWYHCIIPSVYSFVCVICIYSSGHEHLLTRMCIKRSFLLLVSIFRFFYSQFNFIPSISLNHIFI